MRKAKLHLGTASKMPSALDMRWSIGRKLYGQLGPNTVRVGPKTIIKGPCDDVEVEAMKFVSSNTTIPIPRIIKLHRQQGQHFIEMEYIQGDTFDRVWHELTTDQKRKILSQLASYMSQLRRLPPPHDTFVGSADEQSFRDVRIGYDPFGPYNDHDAFHALLRGHIPLEDASKTFAPAVTKCHLGKYKSRFSHGDLTMRIVIVRNDSLQAIIDWEFAGWYPEYWEYTKAYYTQLDVPDFYALLDENLTKYEDALACERVLWQLLNEPGRQLGT